MSSRAWMVAALALSMLAGPVGAPAAHAAVVPLAATTVLSGRATAPVRVVVPRDATLDLTLVEGADGVLRPAAFDVISGRGFVGLMLTEPGSTDGFFAIAARPPERLRDASAVISAVGYAQPAVAHRAEPGLLQEEPPMCVRCVVPAGEYDLYLIAGQGATSVRLTLGGLSGSASLAVPQERHLFDWTNWDSFASSTGALG